VSDEVVSLTLSQIKRLERFYHAMTNDKSLIKSQIEYYRARAGEYDEWFLRKGRYDRGEEHRNRWFTEVDKVRAALKSAKPSGNILDLACGTGLWTEYLIPRATRLVAVDISPEVIEIHRRKHNDSRIEYMEADLFSWQPTEQFDFIFFGFWLSHIPEGHLDEFWNMIADALAPNGKVFFVDSLLTQDSTARNHKSLDRSGTAVRKLNDGREFEVVKVFHDPEVLEDDLRDRGWTGYVRATENFFIYGSVTKS
jgi:demethylmenaquinone methyltransferase/2-methoxy-6-polyprenyl-1,4-benzoquinol methylase